MNRLGTIRKSARLSVEPLEARSLPAVILPMPPTTDSDAVVAVSPESGEHDVAPIVTQDPGQPSVPPPSTPGPTAWNPWRLEYEYIYLSARPPIPGLTPPAALSTRISDVLLAGQFGAHVSAFNILIKPLPNVVGGQDHELITPLDEAIRKLKEIEKAGKAPDATSEQKQWAERATKALSDLETGRQERNTAKPHNRKNAQTKVKEAEHAVITQASLFRIDEILRNRGVLKADRERILTSLEQNAKLSGLGDSQTPHRPNKSSFHSAAHSVYPDDYRAREALRNQLENAWPVYVPSN